MANDPFRLRVLKGIAAVLETITPDANHNFDMTGKVFRGRTVFGSSDPLPMISILEAPIQEDQLSTPPDDTSGVGRWELVIQGFMQDDKKNPTDPGHVLMALVKAKLVEEKRKNGPRGGYTVFGIPNLIKQVYIGPGVVRPPDEVSSVAYFWLTISIDMVEDLEDPFA